MNYFIMPGLPKQPNQWDPKFIIDKICRYYNMPPSKVIGPRRDADIVWPRHVCMYMLRMSCRMPLKAIAKIFKRDHTTVIAACAGVKDRIDTETQRRQEVIEIQAFFVINQSTI